MVAEFNEAGIHFRYPANWQLDRQENEAGWTVSVQSPETAFLMLYLREDMPSPPELADAALETLKAEYSDLEADDCVESLAGQPAIGHNIRFFSLDLTNTCWTRSFPPPGHDPRDVPDHRPGAGSNEPVLRAICASLQVDDE